MADGNSANRHDRKVGLLRCSLQDADSYRKALDTAQQCYDDTTNSNAAVLAMVVTLQNAELAFRVANSKGDAPKVTTVTYVARGATGALGRSIVEGRDIME